MWKNTRKYLAPPRLSSRHLDKHGRRVGRFRRGSAGDYGERSVFERLESGRELDGLTLRLNPVAEHDAPKWYREEVRLPTQVQRAISILIIPRCQKLADCRGSGMYRCARE